MVRIVKRVGVLVRMQYVIMMKVDVVTQQRQFVSQSSLEVARSPAQGMYAHTRFDT